MSIAYANDVGRFPVDEPLLLVQGTADTTVVPERHCDLFARLCTHGQITQFVEVSGAGHGDVLTRSLSTVQGWMTDRLAGGAPPNTCVPPAIPTISAGSGSVIEGGPGTTSLQIPVRLSTPARRRGDRSLEDRPRSGESQSHPGRVGHRLRGRQWNLRSPPGTTKAFVTILVRGDAVPEADELVYIALGRPTRAVLGGYLGLGFGSLVDDD